MKKKHYLLIIAMVVLFVLLSIAAVALHKLLTVNVLPAAGDEMSEQGLIEALRNSAVTVTVGEYHGSGVIVLVNDREIRVITSAHLMEGYEQGIVSFANGKAGFGNVSGYYADRDFCILSLLRQDMAEDFCDGLTAASIDADRLEEIVAKEQIYVVESSINAGANTLVGKVIDTDYYVPDFDMRMLYLYIDATEGMSGAGCFDSEGYLLGLLVGGTENSEAVCVRISDICPYLEN